MKKLLTKIDNNLYHYKDGKKVIGKNDDLNGDCTDLQGNCSGLHGDCTDLYGDCSGLIGNCTGLRGDLDDCEITADERKGSVLISDLIKELK